MSWRLRLPCRTQDPDTEFRHYFDVVEVVKMGFDLCFDAIRIGAIVEERECKGSRRDWLGQFDS
jgi:hypothetical protein